MKVAHYECTRIPTLHRIKIVDQMPVCSTCGIPGVLKSSAADLELKEKADAAAKPTEEFGTWDSHTGWLCKCHSNWHNAELLSCEPCGQRRPPMDSRPPAEAAAPAAPTLTAREEIAQLRAERDSLAKKLETIQAAMDASVLFVVRAPIVPERTFTINDDNGAVVATIEKDGSLIIHPKLQSQLVALLKTLLVGP